MSEFEYLTSLLSDCEDKAEETAKKKDNAKPLLPKFPPKDTVSVVQFQFFDNTGKQARKGYSTHVLKLEVHHDGVGHIRFEEPAWYRYVQLIDPRKVVKWARKSHAAGRMHNSILQLYEDALEVIGAFLENEGDGAIAWMGHISDPNNRGKHYFPGQFVMVLKDPTGDMQAHVCVEGDTISCDQFKQNKKAVQSGARDLYGFYDPHNIRARQLDHLKKLRELNER